MKRLLLLPILMLGFSLACDQSYEEIVGIKVGCPFKSAVNVKDYTKGDPLLGGDFFYKDTDRDQLFNFEGLIIVGGNIEGLALRETRKPISFKDFTSHVNEMEQSFGKAQISEDDDIYIAHFNNIVKGSLVSYVDAILDKNDGSMLTTYRTKAVEEAQRKEDEKVRRWSAKGIWMNAAEEK